MFQVYDSLKGITRCIEETEIQDDSYDLVISSSDPKSSHLFVYELYQRKRLKKTPWVQIWGDPFAADITNTSLIYRWKAKREEENVGAAEKRIFCLQGKDVVQSPGVSGGEKDSAGECEASYESSILREL